MLKTGKISENIYKRAVLKRIKNYNKAVKVGPGLGRDYSLIEIDQERFLINSIASVEVIDDNSLYFGLNQLANRIYEAGAELISFSIDILLPEAFEENQLREYISKLDSIAKEAKASISACDVKVSSSVNRPIISVCASGLANKEDLIYPGKAEAGDDIVITKWIGLEGTSLIAQKEESSLKKRFSSSFIDTAIDFSRYISVWQEAKLSKELGAHAVHNAGHGGIFAGLWEIAGAQGLGCSVELLSIPLKQQTVEICEEYGLNPYELISGGALIIATPRGKELVRALEEKGINSVIVGKITEGNDRLLINGDERRFLESPRGDEIYKIIY